MSSKYIQDLITNPRIKRAFCQFYKQVGNGIYERFSILYYIWVMRKFCCILFCSFLFSILSYGQNAAVFHLEPFPQHGDDDSFNDPGITLQDSWKYHKGDDPHWAASAADDHDWPFVNTALDLSALPEKGFEGIGWF